MPLTQHLSESNAENRFRTLLLTLFALTAISLAAIGLYGTLSCLVALRNREIGLRMALGALPSQIRTRFLAQGSGISLLGCISGLAIAAAFSRLLAGMLYDVSRLDPLTYVPVAIGVLAIATAASALPASRAAHLDPMKSYATNSRQSAPLNSSTGIASAVFANTADANANDAKTDPRSASCFVSWTYCGDIVH